MNMTTEYATEYAVEYVAEYVTEYIAGYAARYIQKERTDYAKRTPRMRRKNAQDAQKEHTGYA